MLHVKNIRKEYVTGDLVQVALDDVSLDLRKNEFVAVLGPSGSGKTTLLNIIGGLDRYDEGDLIINGISTKNYKDRDWDSYRNHTIGFVFQSYNLIPHQSILSNVELALTISGVGRSERRRKALEALDQVGLKEQAHKRPNQMSGGQMQRVAIARALVNDPDILLADEPTGALDTKTSLQVMDLLKEVAKDRLVVMVTHNPELAEQYATRIIRLQDGKIISDSDPYVSIEEKTASESLGKAHMSFLTALSLSFNNLLTKKGRTLLTAFAGSIGIIGIALILSLSTGFQNYIDKIQEDTLSSYPLTITSETADASTMILSMVSDRDREQADGTIRERQYITSVFSGVGSNDIPSFKKYLESHEEEYRDDVSLIRYTYSVNPQIYTIDAADHLVKINPSSMMSTVYSQGASSFLTSYSSAGAGIFSEMPEDEDMYIDHYEVIAGRWPKEWNEAAIVLSDPSSISDLLVYSLGLRDTEELRDMMNKMMNGEESAVKHESLDFTYEDLLSIDMRLIDASKIYRYNNEYSVYEDMSSDDVYMRGLYEKSDRIVITGIVSAKEGSSSMALSPGVVYPKALTKHVIDTAQDSVLVRKQLTDPDTDVFSGKPFDEKEASAALNFEDMISIDQDALAKAFTVNIPDSLSFDPKESADTIMNISSKTAEKLEDTTGQVLGAVLALDAGISRDMIDSYPLYVNSFTCEIYADDSDPSKGCLIPEGKEEDYITVKDVILPKNTVISFSEETSESYLNDYWNTASFELPEDMDLSAFGNIDVSMVKDVISPVSDPVFRKYTETVRNYTDEYGNITLEALQSIPSSEIISSVMNDPGMTGTIYDQATGFTRQYMTMMIAAGIGEATAEVMKPLSSLLNDDLLKIDTDAFAKAFRFTMDQEELSRLMSAMMESASSKSAKSNLLSLGYQDPDNPTSVSFYFKDFEGKENFLDFLKRYNENVEEEKEIRYTDITGILMNSVKTIVDSVSYVLIAFVSISLIVSSIMIAVITLISVMERTKEIGILRAMGASKRNISSIFNAETFIIGLLSGLLGVGVSLLLLIPINHIIHTLTGNPDITAVLPVQGAIALVIISFVLTIIAGFIPSKSAARKDPVIALRTE